MLINIHNVRNSGRTGKRGHLTILEAQEIRGDVELALSAGPKTETISLADNSLPQFVAELKLFLFRARNYGSDTWSNNFAPFLDGQFDGKKLTIKTGSSGGKGGEVLDVMSMAELEKLDANLIALEASYGCLKPRPEAFEQGWGRDISC